MDTRQAEIAVELDLAHAALKAASKIASDRLRAIWNPETRGYEPYEEMLALHAIINKNVAVYYALAAAARVAAPPDKPPNSTSRSATKEHPMNDTTKRADLPTLPAGGEWLEIVIPVTAEMTPEQAGQLAASAAQRAVAAVRP